MLATNTHFHNCYSGIFSHFPLCHCLSLPISLLLYLLLYLVSYFLVNYFKQRDILQVSSTCSRSLACLLIHLLTPSIIHILTHTRTLILTHPPIHCHSLTRTFIRLLTLITHPLTFPLTYTCTLTLPPSLPLTHSLTRSLIHSPTHSL